MKVLVVDDSATARLIVTQTMERDGHAVLEAENGAVALAVLEAHPDVDVLILDWSMPVMNGIDCLEAVRSRPDLGRITVVMCATEAEKPSVMAAIKAGANGFVRKPVTGPSLIQGVTRALGIGTGTGSKTGDGRRGPIERSAPPAP